LGKKSKKIRHGTRDGSVRKTGPLGGETGEGIQSGGGSDTGEGPSQGGGVNGFTEKFPEGGTRGGGKKLGKK